jgi:hypothetical protein
MLLKHLMSLLGDLDGDLEVLDANTWAVVTHFVVDGDFVLMASRPEVRSVDRSVVDVFACGGVAS